MAIQRYLNEIIERFLEIAYWDIDKNAWCYKTGTKCFGYVVKKPGEQIKRYNNGVRAIEIYGKRYALHRMAFMIYHDLKLRPGDRVSFRDGNVENLRKDNLYLIGGKRSKEIRKQYRSMYRRVFRKPTESDLAGNNEIKLGKLMSKFMDIAYWDPRKRVWRYRKDRYSARLVAKADDPIIQKANGFSSFAIDGKRYHLHRLAYMYFHRIWLKQSDFIEHIDGDKTNNSKENLLLNRQNKIVALLKSQKKCSPWDEKARQAAREKRLQKYGDWLNDDQI